MADLQSTGAQDPSLGMTRPGGNLTSDDMQASDPVGDDEVQGTKVGKGEQATPEQQELYERIVTNAEKIIHDEQHSDGFVRLMQNEGLGDAIHSVLSSIVKGLEGKQVDVPSEVLVGTLPEVTALLLELGEAEGITFEPDVIKQSMMEAVDKLVGEAAGSGGADLTGMANGGMDPVLRQAGLDGSDPTAAGEQEQPTKGML